MFAEGEGPALPLLLPSVVFDPRGTPAGSALGAFGLSPWKGLFLGTKPDCRKLQEFSTCVENNILYMLQ